MIIITLKDIITIILFLIILLYILLSYILNVFKKNCYKCKNYKLYDTGAGQYCKYKCQNRNRIDIEDYNTRCHFEWCKNFERNEE